MEQDVTVDPTDPAFAVVVWGALSLVRDRLPAKVKPWIPYLAVILGGLLRGVTDAISRGTVDGSTLVRAGATGAAAVLLQASARAPAKARRAVAEPRDGAGR